MLLNVLWHHQGGSSPVGQPIRSIVGLGKHDRMTDEQVANAKWIDRLLAAAPDAPSAEPVAVVDANDDGYRADILPNRSVKVGQPLYAIPPDAAAEIAKLRAEVERLTEKNAELREKMHDESAQSVRFILHDHPKALSESYVTIAQQAERIAELESSLEIEKGQCELREEENRILFARMEAQAAAMAKAKEALEGVCDSDEECQDSDGWTAAVISFEALHEAQEALETIAQFDGAHAEEHAHPASDADNAIYQSIARNYTAQAGEEGKEPRHD